MNNYPFSQSLLSITQKMMFSHDKLIFKRKRKLNTFIIFKFLLVSAITNYGVSTLTKLFNYCSHTAIIKARKLFRDNLFYDINASLPLKNNIYAIDGSKIRVHGGFTKYGYTTRTCNSQFRAAKRPLAMLSALVGIQSDTITNYTVTTHFNERKCVYTLTKNLNIGDIVIMDRGYFSAQLYSHFYSNYLIPIFRLKKDANKTVSLFYKSKLYNLHTFVYHEDTKIPIHYVKYRIDKKIYLLATTPNGLSNYKLKKLYALRWRTEVSFKRLKSHLHINTIYATSHFLWKQELQFRILLDTLTKRASIIHKTKKKKPKQKYAIINYKFILLQLLTYYKIVEFGIT